MELISREALVNDLCEDREEGTFCFTDSQAEAADKIIVYVTKRINAQPSVPAVPLDKLCELCEETSAKVPCVLCDKIMPEWCKQNNNLPLKWGEEWKCPTWKQLLTKWMEEQDAAD